MNPDNGTSESVTAPHVVAVPPQLIKYLEGLEQSFQDEKQRGIHEQFRNVRCFEHILGTSTTFKLIYDKPVFSKANILIEPKNWGSAPIKLWQGSVPNTMAMSLHNENEPAFLSYVNNSNEVTVFCPEMQEPISRITTREGTDASEILCLATGESLTTTIMQSDIPASMRITDSHGRVVGAASVTSWKTIRKYSTSTYLKQFEMQLENGLSEPTRVMLLVAFATWAMSLNDRVQNENRTKKIVGFGISAVFIVVLILVLHYYRN